MIGNLSHNSVSGGHYRSHAGFTLIELVVVIVILGILAASAAPKFMSLQADARAASLKALMGAVKSANSMVYGKAMIVGTDVNYTERGATITKWKADCTTNNCVEIDGVSVYFKFAYLDRNSVVFALDADIEGRKTLTISSQGKTLVIPDRCGNGQTPDEERDGACGTATKFSINYLCSSYKPTEVCQDHDFCQCRLQEGGGPARKDSQYFIPRGMPYTGGNCYFKYTTAELVTGKVPVYKIETSGC